MAEAKQEGSPAATADLLIEIGCEELPPRALDELRDFLFAAMRSGLEREGLEFDAAASRAFSTPRRLAMLFSQVRSRQADQDQERRGPSLDVAFDAAGNPTSAARGFARSLGLDVSDLQKRQSGKGGFLVAHVHLPGKSLGELIFPVLDLALRQLPVPRPMRWADHDFTFVRPVHWLLVMHGEHVLDGKLLGQTAGNCTRGHRVHAPGPHVLKRAGDYLETLRAAFVLADPEERRQVIRAGLHAREPSTRIDADLLNEVGNLVEWPVAVACSFDPEFLALPPEVLIASMQDHQRFFPVLADELSGAVSNRFMAIANLESRDVKQVREGFERVIRPRLADAQFFRQQDQKQPLEARIPLLDEVVFQQKIGSVGDKSRRISSLSQKIASKLEIDPVAARRAAQLAKCDLLTEMVGEFPELQGIMGRYYALHSGEPAEVAEAIEQHYLPRFAGDTLPASGTGQVVGLADRADTLVACFAAGLKPSGNKDPFALRRCALGLVRILAESRLSLPLDRLLALAANELGKTGGGVQPADLLDVREFVNERARAYYREAGHGAELVQAAMTSAWDTFPDLQSRLEALSAFLGQEAGQSLAAANKRIGNILKKAKIEIVGIIDEDAFVLDEERQLFKLVSKAEKTLKPLLQRSDYAASLEHLSLLRPPVDRFFDAVMVMDEDPALRSNRLALLARLKGLFDRIADLSVLA